MTALVEDRATLRGGAGVGHLRTFAVASDTRIWNRSIVNLDTSGDARPGRTNASDVCVGIAQHRADNRDVQELRQTAVNTMTGIFRFENSAGADEITATDIGSDCFVVDDQTVALTDGSSTRCRAGKIHDVDDDGVWVNFDA